MNDDKAKKVIHVPGYDGEERRNNSRRVEDFYARHIKLIFAVLGVVLSLLTTGIAWGVTKASMEAAINSKVDKEEFMAKNMEQDKKAGELAAMILDMRNSVSVLAPAVTKLEQRLGQIYCDGKPPGCR